MKVYRELHPIEKDKHAVVTIGTFDGLHLGHQKIINRMKEVAAGINGETVILSFFPHPRMILHPEDTWLKLLNTIPEKIELLEKMGVDNLIITPFTRDFSNMSCDEFTLKVLADTLHTRKLIIGYDHRFGKNREGGFESLSLSGPVFGFEVEKIPEQDIDDIAISSTKIREALLAGNIETATKYLQYAYPLHGEVMLGDQIGRTLGYPTANILVTEPYKLIPGDGIYAVRIFVAGQHYRGMLYIGNRPVVNGMSRSIEVNIFDFNQDIYGQDIAVEFLHYIRGDGNFTSLDELKNQMGKDKIKCLELMAG